MGDKVYYKRVDCPEWKGPGTVIGQDGAVVFVRHGGTCIRVHRLRLRKVNTESEDQHATKTDVENDTDIKQGQEFAESNRQLTEETENEVQQEVRQMEDTRGQNEAEQHTSDNTETPSGTKLETVVSLQNGQIIKYSDNEKGILCTAKVLGRAGKATGKYKNWYNLLLIEPTNVAGSRESADMSNVENIQIESTVTNADSTDVCEDVYVTKDVTFDFAKQEEIKSWRDNHVFEEVKNEGQKCISTRWVCTYKETLEGFVPKARLVARGFEELEVSELKKDSPTCASESLRLLVALICQRQWTLNSMDIKSAFLQGMELSRDLYIKPPPEANNEGKLWKLKSVCMVWLMLHSTGIIE